MNNRYYYVCFTITHLVLYRCKRMVYIWYTFYRKVG